MITDFVKLLPELYGVRSCTANSHALSHIPFYVRLWGPLWTHSAFGFESQNGHLKNMIHGKCCALDQLVFSADVALTLRQARGELANESDAVKNLVCKLTGEEMRSNMTEIGVAMYRIGKIESTQDECTLIGSGSTTELTFSRAYYEGVLYHSKQYARHNGKRNSTHTRVVAQQFNTVVSKNSCNSLNRWQSSPD